MCVLFLLIVLQFGTQILGPSDASLNRVVDKSVNFSTQQRSFSPVSILTEDTDPHITELVPSSLFDQDNLFVHLFIHLVSDHFL